MEEPTVPDEAVEHHEFSTEIVTWMGHATFEIIHRLGNDLGLVRAQIRIIRKRLEHLGVDDEVIEKYLSSIQEQVEGVLDSSLQLVEQVRGFDSDSDGPEESDLGRVAEEVFEHFEGGNDTVRMSFAVDPEAARVRAAPRHVHDILYNLVKNAIEALPSGQGRVEIQARRDGDRAVITIADDGQGIPPKQLPRIFDLAFTTKKSSGFGLWSAKRMAQHYGGDLTVTRSNKGEGTTFTLTLPRFGAVERPAP